MTSEWINIRRGELMREIGDKGKKGKNLYFF
jgi:hypothetical protein